MFFIQLDYHCLLLNDWSPDCLNVDGCGTRGEIHGTSSVCVGGSKQGYAKTCVGLRLHVYIFPCLSVSNVVAEENYDLQRKMLVYVTIGRIWEWSLTTGVLIKQFLLHQSPFL